MGLANVQLDGIATHFPSADVDPEFTRAQIERADQLRAALPETRHFHLSNSAGLLEFAEAQSSATLMRPGLMLYGVSPLPQHQAELEPVLTLKSRVLSCATCPPDRA